MVKAIMIKDNYQTSISIMAQLLQHGASILILPIIIFNFSPEAIGLWYLLVSFQSAIFLMDMGFTPSFSRAIAQAFSGIPSLKATGWHDANTNMPNHNLIYQIIRRMKLAYFLLSISSLFILFFGGFFYLSSVALTEFTIQEVKIICIISALSISVQFSGQWMNAALVGAGLTYLSQVSIVISRITFLLFGLLLIYFEKGVLGLTIANLLGILIGLILKFYFYINLFPKIKIQPNKSINQSVLSKIWYNSWRIGVVSLCTFLVLRFGVLLLGLLEGVEKAGTLGLLIQISTAIIAASSMPWHVGLKKLVSIKLSKNIKLLRKFATTNWLLSFTIFALAFLSIIVFEAIGFLKNTQFENLIFSKLFLLYFVIVMLELNHTIATFFIAAGNDIPFLPAALLSALFTIILSVILVINGWGIFGVLFAQGLIQLLWNNWYWPWRVLKELS